MNTECVYLLKPEDQSFKNYLELAKFINNGRCERYANSIAKIIKPVEVYTDLNARDGWVSGGKKITLSPGNLVLFVGGKLHYMVPIYGIGSGNPANVLHPSRETQGWFEDLISIDNDPDFEELMKLPEPELTFPEDAEYVYKYTEDNISDVVPEGFSFKGKRICVHGKFRAGARKEIEAYLKSEGAVVTSTVSGKTEVLLIGEDAGFNFFDYGYRGVKVENAIVLKKYGSPILILMEKHVIDRDKVAAIKGKINA